MNWDRKRRYDRLHHESRARPDQIKRLHKLTGLPRRSVRGISQTMCAQLMEYYGPKPVIFDRSSQQPTSAEILDSTETRSSVAAIGGAGSRKDGRPAADGLLLLRAHIVTVLSRSERPMKARELARAISNTGQKVTKREVNSVLYRLEREGAVIRNPDSTWQK